MDRLTPELLREHGAKDRHTLGWADQAAALLKWAADVIEAAEKALHTGNDDNG